MGCFSSQPHAAAVVWGWLGNRDPFLSNPTFTVIKPPHKGLRFEEKKQTTFSTFSTFITFLLFCMTD